MNSIRELLESYIQSAAVLIRLKVGYPAYLKLAEQWVTNQNVHVDESWLNDNLGLVPGAEHTWPNGPQHFIEKHLKWELLAHPSAGSQIRLLEGPIGDLCSQYLKYYPKLRINGEQQVEVLQGNTWIPLNARAILPMPLSELTRSLEQTALPNGSRAVFHDRQPWWVEIAIEPFQLIFQPPETPPQEAEEDGPVFEELDALVSQLEIPATKPVCQISLSKNLVRKPTARQLEPLINGYLGRRIEAIAGHLPRLVLGPISLATGNVRLNEADIAVLKSDPALSAPALQFNNPNVQPDALAFWKLENGQLQQQNPFQSSSQQYPIQQAQMPASLLAETIDRCLVRGANEILAYDSSGQNVVCPSGRNDLPPQAQLAERSVVLAWKARESSLLGRMGLTSMGLEAHFFWTANARRPRALSRFAVTKKPELAWSSSPGGKYLVYLQDKGSKARLTRIDVDEDHPAGETDLAIDLRQGHSGIQIQLDEDGNCAILYKGDLWLTERLSKNCSRETVGDAHLLGINNLSAIIAFPPEHTGPRSGYVGWQFLERSCPSVAKSKPKLCDLSSLLSQVSLYEWLELCPGGACVGYRNYSYFALPFVVPSLQALESLAGELRTKAAVSSEFDCFELELPDCRRSVEVLVQSIRLTQYFFDGELHRFPLQGKPTAR